MTSNLGATLLKKSAGLGFAEQSAVDTYERLKSLMLGEAKRVFKPELINRFDDIVVFRQLTREDVNLISGPRTGQNFGSSEIPGDYPRIEAVGSRLPAR